MAARSRPRAGQIKEELDEERSLWGQILEDAKRIDLLLVRFILLFFLFSRFAQCESVHACFTSLTTRGVLSAFMKHDFCWKDTYEPFPDGCDLVFALNLLSSLVLLFYVLILTHFIGPAKYSQ